MNPDHQPTDLVPDHVEWVPSSPEAIEVRVFGTWTGPTVPPAAVLVVGDARFEASGAPGSDVPPAWSASFLVPVELRPDVEAGSASVELGASGRAVSLPAAVPGRLTPEVDAVVVDPAVFAERRARRAEIAEQSAADRAGSAEQAAETLRAQLSQLEERVSRAGAERDGLAARVADAERRLRLAEQREEAERRRRGELEDEAATARRETEDELSALRDRLASAEEVAEALERQLAHARHRVDTERAARERVDEQLREALARVTELEGSAGSEAEDLRRQAAVLSDRLVEAEAERARLEEARATVEQLETTRAEVTELRLRLAGVESALEAERDARTAAESRLQAESSARTAAESQLEAEHAARAAAEARLEEERRAHELAARQVQEETSARERTARLLEDERAARLAAEERAASPGSDVGAGADRALLDQVATLEAELSRRAATQQRVQAAVDAVRGELARVREQVDAGRGTAEIDALTRRAEELEGVVRERDAELDRARTSLRAAEQSATDLRALVEDQHHRHAADEQSLRAGFEARIRELTGEVATMRRRLHATIADLEARLEAERRARLAAEAQLAGRAADADAPTPDAPPIPGTEGRSGDAPPTVEARPAGRSGDAPPTVEARPARPAHDRPTPPVPPAAAAEPSSAAPSPGPGNRFAAPPSSASPPRVDDAGETTGTGDAALDALIAGLRAQVESAREQLEAWEDQEGGTAETPAAAPPAPGAAPPPSPAATRSPGDAAPASPPSGAAPPDTPAPPRGDVPSVEDAADLPLPSPDEQTRLRLQAIEADLRAAVPDPESSAPAREVIASLQQAADRLRAAAEDELARADAPAAQDPAPAEDTAAPPVADAVPPAGDPSTPPASGSRTAPPDDASALGPRAVDFGARETPWLRTAIERLAIADPERAADVFLALLPAQATVGGAFTYLVTAPTLGAVRVGVTPGAVQVERRPDAPTAEVTLSGSLATLAPLAAGGAGWRLRGVRVDGTKRHARRLTRARRRPLALSDLALLGTPPRAGTVLTALAAAVDPAWTAGHRFGVSYVVAGAGRWTVVADDGSALRVLDNGGEHPHAAVVRLPAEAVLPLLQGAPLPPAHRPALTGDRRAVDVLHAWFDRARGVAGR